MNKYFRIATLIFTLIATPSIVSAQSSAEDLASGYQLELLPPEILAQVKHLMTFGGRYEKTIRQIILEAAKPDWSWGE